jgi:hypothetical protein
VEEIAAAYRNCLLLIQYKTKLSMILGTVELCGLTAYVLPTVRSMYSIGYRGSHNHKSAECSFALTRLTHFSSFREKLSCSTFRRGLESNESQVEVSSTHVDFWVISN